MNTKAISALNSRFFFSIFLVARMVEKTREKVFIDGIGWNLVCEYFVLSLFCERLEFLASTVEMSRYCLMGLNLANEKNVNFS